MSDEVVIDTRGGQVELELAEPRACEACGYVRDELVLHRWELFVAKQPPSQNDLRSNHGRGRFAYQSLRRTWRDLLWLEARRVGIHLAESRRRLWFTRLIQKGGRAYDYGNFVGGCKPLVDAMSAKRDDGIGLVVDDSPRWLEQYYHQRRASDGRAGLLLRIEELAQR